MRRCYTGSQLPLGKVWEYLALVSPHRAVGTERHWSRCLRSGGNFRPALNITHSLTSPAAQLAVISVTQVSDCVTTYPWVTSDFFLSSTLNLGVMSLHFMDGIVALCLQTSLPKRYSKQQEHPNGNMSWVMVESVASVNVR